MSQHPIYEPDDDSFLMVEALDAELSSIASSGVSMSGLSLLDMGSGTGVIGETALKKGCSVTFADVNPLAVDFMKKKFLRKKNALVVESDLFKNVPVRRFDLITFNTPYLPDDEDLWDPALHGGPIGYEVTVRFLDDVLDYLSKDGVLIFLISSLTHPDVIEAKLYDLGLEHSIVGRKKLFLEELLVYRVVCR